MYRREAPKSDNQLSLTSPIHFFRILHTLILFLENMGAGRDVLKWRRKEISKVADKRVRSGLLSGQKIKKFCTKIRTSAKPIHLTSVHRN